MEIGNCCDGTGWLLALRTVTGQFLWERVGIIVGTLCLGVLVKEGMRLVHTLFT